MDHKQNEQNIDERIQAREDRIQSIKQALADQRKLLAEDWYVSSRISYLRFDQDTAVRKIRKAIELAPDNTKYQGYLQKLLHPQR